MSVLVTGASGVVGLHVARELASSGLDVVAYSTSGAPPHSDLVLREVRPRIRFEVGNILDYSRLDDVASRFGIEGIVHAAALTGEAQARARAREVVSVNVLGTTNLLELARARSMRRVVFLGSASEYGRRADRVSISEDELHPDGLYAETKFLGHRLAQRYREIFGLDAITIRVSSVFGPNTRFNPFRKLVGNTLIAHLCRSVALGVPVILESGGDYPRDWTYVADTAHGVGLAYLAEKPSYTTYNIASGRSYVLSEVVDALRAVAPNAEITIGPGQWQEDPLQSLNLRGPLDISKAQRDLNFQVKFDLESGLRHYVEWWREVEGKT